jgi:hypothetical protein
MKLQILTSSFQWKNNIPTQFYDWRGFETLNQTLTISEQPYLKAT